VEPSAPGLLARAASSSSSTPREFARGERRGLGEPLPTRARAPSRLSSPMVRASGPCATWPHATAIPRGDQPCGRSRCWLEVRWLRSFSIDCKLTQVARCLLRCPAEPGHGCPRSNRARHCGWRECVGTDGSLHQQGAPWSSHACSGDRPGPTSRVRRLDPRHRSAYRALGAPSNLHARRRPHTNDRHSVRARGRVDGTRQRRSSDASRWRC